MSAAAEPTETKVYVDYPYVLIKDTTKPKTQTPTQKPSVSLKRGKINTNGSKVELSVLEKPEHKQGTIESINEKGHVIVQKSDKVYYADSTEPRYAEGIEQVWEKSSKNGYVKGEWNGTQQTIIYQNSSIMLANQHQIESVRWCRSSEEEPKKVPDLLVVCAVNKESDHYYVYRIALDANGSVREIKPIEYKPIDERKCELEFQSIFSTNEAEDEYRKVSLYIGKEDSKLKVTVVQPSPARTTHFIEKVWTISKTSTGPSVETFQSVPRWVNNLTTHYAPRNPNKITQKSNKSVEAKVSKFDSVRGTRHFTVFQNDKKVLVTRVEQSEPSHKLVAMIPNVENDFTIQNAVQVSDTSLFIYGQTGQGGDRVYFVYKDESTDMYRHADVYSVPGTSNGVLASTLESKAPYRPIQLEGNKGPIKVTTGPKLKIFIKLINTSKVQDIKTALDNHPRTSNISNDALDNFVTEQLRRILKMYPSGVSEYKLLKKQSSTTDVGKIRQTFRMQNGKEWAQFLKDLTQQFPSNEDSPSASGEGKTEPQTPRSPETRETSR